jgi:endogenous inhibitor of DNA gyrase (YacG/DUF329 family)
MKEKEKVYKNCIHCGKEFNAIRHWMKFCCKKCRMNEWINNHPRIYGEIGA